MNLRPYQLDCVDKHLDVLRESPSALIVKATGTGKTVTFSEIIRRRQASTSKRSIVVAHRDELVNQAANKIARVTGERPEIEMAGQRADMHFFQRSGCIVASVPSLQRARLERFNPDDFSDLIIDEAHHSIAKTYRNIIGHFCKNPELRLTGVTATPDRSDEEALGQIFGTVSFIYELPNAIMDGWLVSPQQQTVIIEDLDFSDVRTTAGDLNGRDLAKLMESEKNLQAIAGTTIKESGERKTLVFTASLAQAERTCEIFNRHRPGSARWVHGGTPREERRELLRDYAARKFQYLVNVGVATEGFDDPGIECVAIGRPTESRPLYCQMVGRGTRLLEGVVEQYDSNGELVSRIESAEERRVAISKSSKRDLLVLDFEGNAGRHKLVSVVDIVAGKYSDEAAEIVRKSAAAGSNAGGPVDVLHALDEAELQVTENKKREAEKQRSNIVAQVAYKLKSVDPFDVFDIAPQRARGWDNAKTPSPKMIDMLHRNGIKTDGLSFPKCQQLIKEIILRRERDLCSFKQAAFLRSHGVEATSMSFPEAKTRIDQIIGGGGNGGGVRVPYKPKPVAIPGAGVAA